MFDTDAIARHHDPDALTTVVIVNANPSQRRRLVCALEARGHRVVGYASARAAIASMTPPRRTVMLVDHDLKEMSGVDFIDEVRARGLRLPAIMIVPMHAVQAAVQAIRNGATDVLEAPLDDAVVAQSVRQALARDDEADSAR
jgi:FixJ family two-component response regulator